MVFLLSEYITYYPRRIISGSREFIIFKDELKDLPLIIYANVRKNRLIGLLKKYGFANDGNVLYRQATEKWKIVVSMEECTHKESPCGCKIACYAVLEEGNIRYPLVYEVMQILWRENINYRLYYGREKVFIDRIIDNYQITLRDPTPSSPVPVIIALALGIIGLLASMSLAFGEKG